MTRSTRQRTPKSLLPDDSQGHIPSAVTRFGQINFINSLPLTMPLMAASSFDKVSFKLGTPSELNKAFSAGELDLGAMSSFFFLEQSNLSLIPDISIASIGAVGSVLFFADRELKDLRNSVLSITADSATSVNLLKVLFAETYGFIPACETSSNPLIDERISGALVIGDKALHSDTTWSHRLTRVDLGQWWYEKFGLPMVFGVWAAKKEWVSKNEDRFKSICTELRVLFDSGLSREFQTVLEEAHKRTGLSKERLEHYYLRELNFDLTERHRQGLNLYGSLCRKHGLLTDACAQ